MKMKRGTLQLFHRSMVKGIITTQSKHEIVKQQIQRSDHVHKTLVGLTNGNFNNSEDKIDDTKWISGAD